MRAAQDNGVPFLPLDLRPGFGGRRSHLLNTAAAVPLRAGPFPELHGADAPPRKQPSPNEFGEEGLECLETDDDAYTTNWYDACWRVLVSNPPQGGAARRMRVSRRRQLSFLGKNGHIERANAWTHVVGTLGFLIFASARAAAGLNTESLAGSLSTFTSVVVAITFAVSTSYHTLGTVRWLAPLMRMLDHGAIDVALAVASTTDMAVVTLDFKDVPWQSYYDSIFVSVVIMVFFTYRRIVLPAEDTEMGWGDCRLGLFRLQHADYEYSSLRSSSYVVLSFGFISLVPAAMRNLTATAFDTLIVCNAAALGMLILGLLLDNVLLWPDLLYQEAGRRRQQKPNLMCHSTQCGCIMSSHAWWHVLTLLSVVTQTVGREVAIAETAGAF